VTGNLDDLPRYQFAYAYSEIDRAAILASIIMRTCGFTYSRNSESRVPGAGELEESIAEKVNELLGSDEMGLRSSGRITCVGDKTGVNIYFDLGHIDFTEEVSQ
jgi:hypothetical protein